MTDVLKYDFCTMHIHDTYLIVEMNDGIHVTPDHNKILLNIADTYYKNKPFVYLTHRVNSYSVDPAIYAETSKIKNLIGFAVISGDFKKKSNAEIEKLFFNKTFKIFDTIEDAVVWAKSITTKK
ncbi:hypothetical protein RM697_02930 [Ichthyenterobacterium sp. W332]|uniref:STAS/SEC14 domain-containing protein n=1 Tax=Microcosmobacter mediterraneus TaxID=3075607 RepID=A0ABU2YHE2_9FLAO|nr:hypothetical protein [Ichthyenterobacterium sp. W332]MDT0557586.1 hypothetical protein [Ichthyenterobacterium sp. W332]